MRGITKILAMALLALLFTGSAWAYSFSFDLSKLGLKTNEFSPRTLITDIDFIGIANDGTYPLATIKQDLGANGVLSDGDTFSEAGLLGITDFNNDGLTFLTNANVRAYIYFEFTGLSGSISNVVGNEYDINFTPGVGNISLRVATGNTFSSQLTDPTIATFNLLNAGTTNFDSTTGVPNSGFGFVYGLSTINPVYNDFWTFEDTGLSAEDYLAMYGTNAVIGTAELTATIKNVDVTNAGPNGYFIYKVQNDGNTQFAPVPEPGTALLLGAGLLGLGAVARRRKN